MVIGDARKREEKPTKQKEIRGGMLSPLIKHYLTGKRLTIIDYNRIVDEQLMSLHSQGVVIKTGYDDNFYTTTELLIKV